MLNWFLPDSFKPSIFHITPDFLMEKGMRGIITDLDNTLVEWDRPLPTPRLAAWFQEMKKSGISIVIVSNNNEKRVEAFSRPLGIPYISRARKPLKKAYLQALDLLGIPKEQTVVVGDQLLTDIFGGKKLGLSTILVVPVADSDGWQTKLNRRIERMILKSFEKKGLLKWEGHSSGK
jgi:HAD superfamily (subfamily IIIA) phosphatase, TIGR01668